MAASMLRWLKTAEDYVNTTNDVDTPSVTLNKLLTEHISAIDMLNVKAYS